MERIKTVICTYSKRKAMNNIFTSQSTSFLLVMLIIFGLSALIKFAVKLFELIVKLAFVLIILFLGFKALEFDDTHTNTPPDKPGVPLKDTTTIDSIVVLGNITYSLSAPPNK